MQKPAAALHGGSRTSSGRRLLYGLLTTASLMGLQAAPAFGQEQAPPAGTPPEQAAEQIRFAIPPQPLSSALTAFGESTGLQVLYAGDVASGVQSPGVSGTYSAEQALQILLAGTGLSYRLTDANTVTLERAVADTGAIALSPITVVGQLDTGYAAKQAISATRTAAERDEIPQTVEVLNRQLIEDVESTRVGDALRFGTGLVNGFSGGPGSRFGDSFFSRGFASNFVNNGLRRGLIGGSNPQDAANIERIEILKGPASVLYGQLEPGGVINLVTKQPLFEPFAEARVKFGSFDFKRISADVSAPLYGDGAVRFRLNAAFEDTDSFKDFFGREHVFVAPVLAVELGPDTLLTLEGEYTRDDFLFEEGIPARGFILPNVNGEFPISRWIGEPSLEGDVVEAGSLGYRLEHRFTDWLVLRNAFRWERFELDEASIIPLALRDDQRTVVRGLLEGDDEQTDDYLVQTDLVMEFPTGFADHELLVGFDYRKEDRDGRTRITRDIPDLDLFNPVYGTASPPTGPFDPFAIEQDTLGVYAQDRITLDKFTLLGGLRYDDSSAENVFISGETGERELSERDDEEVTTQFGVVYRPFEPLSLYANRTESFVPQIGNVFGGEPFSPEMATQYEVGTKLDFFEGFLSANLAAFQITKENVVTTDPNNLGFQLAVGETRSRGIEASIAGQPLPGWNLIASYAFTDTEITRDFEGFEGNEFIGVPDHTASLFSRYDLQDGPFKGLGFGAGINYVGERQGDLDNSFELPDYVRVDLGLYYEPLDNVEASLFVENAFDEEYALSAFGIQRVFPGAPRTFLFSLKASF